MRAEFIERVVAFIDGTGRRLFQQLNEMEQVWCAVEELQPRAFVEIGCSYGGALYVYAGACAPGATVIGVDKRNRDQMLGRTISQLRAEGYRASFIEGNSHGAAVRATAFHLVGDDRPVFVHIDGDHSRDGSWADWRAYGPLALDGLVAFHDIVHEGGVRAAFNAVADTRKREIVGPPRWDGRQLGIGLVGANL